MYHWGVRVYTFSKSVIISLVRYPGSNNVHVDKN